MTMKEFIIYLQEKYPEKNITATSFAKKATNRESGATGRYWMSEKSRYIHKDILNDVKDYVDKNFPEETIKYEQVMEYYGKMKRGKSTGQKNENMDEEETLLRLLKNVKLEMYALDTDDLNFEYDDDYRILLMIDEEDDRIEAYITARGDGEMICIEEYPLSIISKEECLEEAETEAIGLLIKLDDNGFLTDTIRSGIKEYEEKLGKSPWSCYNINGELL